MILTFVVPRVSQVFLKLKVDLPLPTKILVGISDLFTKFTSLIILLSILLFVFGFFIYKSKKRFFLNLIFSLPLLNNLGKYIDLTRFTRSLALLLSSGIPITQALNLSKQVVVRKEIIKAIEKSQEAVESGQKLSKGFGENKKVIPQIMIRLINAGERSGTLEKSMQQVSEFFDNKVSTNLKLITELLEPILLVIIGVLVGGTMLAIVAPIYQLIGQIKVR
jgi:type II secretory pathway component PulF